MQIADLFAALTAHTAALNAHTAALTGSSAKPAATAKEEAADKTAAAAKPGKAPAAEKPAKPAKPKGPTQEEMVGALTEVKEKLGAAVAKEIIAEFSSVAKMADIPEGEYKAVFDAAKAKLAGDDGAETDADDGL